MRERVSDRVHAHLLGLITSGWVAPGDRLPPERTLADDLGVSRPAVREAVQRLAAAHLVEMRQGDGTRVHDFRGVGGPDLIPGLLHDDGVVVVDVARDVLELRRVLGADVAELAAAGAQSRTVDRLGQSLGDLAAATTEAERLAAVEGWWDHVVAAADNLALRLTVNAGLRPAGDVLRAAAAAFPPGPVHPGYTELLGAVASGRRSAARTAADDLLADDRDRVLAVLAGSDGPVDGERTQSGGVLKSGG